MESLTNKIALVTGGGSGICFAFVRMLHEAGCRVLIADLALTRDATLWLESLSHQAGVQFHRTDVTKWQQLKSAVRRCEAVFGDTPDIYVPGAGVFEPNGPSFWKDGEPDEDSRYAVLDINLIHPIKLTRIAVSELVGAQKQGAIIYVSSIAGQRSSIVTPLYTISKHGINSLIRGMAPLSELANIRVAGVAPGYVQSPAVSADASANCKFRTIDTPLYESAEARKLLDLSKDFLLPKEEVAKAMFLLLTNTKYPPGTILEVCDVGEHNWRQVSLLNDNGPQGPASKTSNKAGAIQDIMQYLHPDGMKGYEGTIATD